MGALGPEVQTAGPQDELSSQLFLQAVRYVLISTAGVVELEKRRWVDRHEWWWISVGTSEAAVLALVVEERAEGMIVSHCSSISQ